MASNSFPVAVIGMDVKLPGAESCEEFWKLIIEGQDTVGEFPPERSADISQVLPSFKEQLVNDKKPFFTGSFFKSVDKFDADLFQINPREAMFIEPQQRFFLEAAWKLLEDAGYASRIRGSKTGVYVGNTVNKYKLVLTENHPSICHGNHSPFISSRVSYTLDLKGPALMVATGCSSSLLAVHLACQGLLSGDCDIAIAGGITIDLLPVSTKTDIWNQLGITGPNVKCRAFDACAKGIAKGEGCGAVLLKPLEKALSDGDHIYGILQATTANQDGHSNGITAPHPVAQANMLHQAWKLADICPTKLGYFEAHGTGTELGDPIEISGITKAFTMSGVNTSSEAYSGKVPIGSVKANIGHLADGAAGVVALIKTLLCMNHDKIPPAVNFSTANPHINWQKAPVYVNTSSKDWKPNVDKSPRYASVSAFGLLGTNVHAVVKEHVSSESVSAHPVMSKRKPVTILALAAASKESLVAFVLRMVVYFQNSDDRSSRNLQNVCFTINTGREQNRFDSRAIAYGENWDEMTEALEHLHESLDKVPGDEKKVRLSAGFNTEDNLSGKQDDDSHTALILKQDYLNGKAIQWNKIYCGNLGLQKLPFLPTYAFNRVRYWPKEGKPINEELLRLEHQLAQHKDGKENKGADTKHENSESANNHLNVLPEVDVTLKNKCDKQTKSSQNLQQPKDANLLLRGALNEALGREYDWSAFKDENLFSLGVDSLICTHVNMRIKDALGLNEEAFTMSDLHTNPSFGKILKVIETKLQPLSREFEEDPDDFSAVVATSSKGFFPLSFSQKRLWVMQEIVTNPCVYNATNCLKISGPFHPSAFVVSANTVLSCHGAFFTVFANTPNGLFQTHNWDLLPRVVELDYQDFGDVSEELAMKKYEEDYKGPFDLKEGPLVRCTLYYLSNNEYLFTMVIHHIIFDGWSHFNFYNELWHTYKNACKGEVQKKLMHKPLYVELVSEEQKEAMSASSRISNDLAYWKEKLRGPLPLTSFPGDKRRPPVFSYSGGRITRFIDSDVLSCLEQLTGDGFTIFMTLIATVFSLLHQYTGERDMIIGTPVAGRYQAKTKGVIGCFINTVVLRLQLEDNESFSDILQSVSKVCLEGYDHQHAPFDLLVSELNLPRDTSITPIFNVNVCYHNTEVKAEHVTPPSELHVERKLLHNNSSKWDMQFDFLQETEGMRFTLEYYSDLYSRSYAECVVDNFVGLLNRVARDPSAPISAVKPVTQICNEDKFDPKACLLYGKVRNIGNKTLPNLLIESLSHFSEESFIVDVNGESITYREMLKNAGEIAVFLRKRCEIQSQSRIGLLLNNSIESVTSILACMFAGLVYVPLNCDDPKHRLEHICNESELRAIIFSKSNISLANNLLWSCHSLHVLLCADDKTFEEVLESEQDAPLMNKELWDHVACNSKSDIEAGGWKSSYTGENLSESEMNEYAENVLTKLKKYIKPDSRILEIGCASGITAKKIYPLVGRYVATDLSQSMVDRLSDALEESKVEVYCASAHKVGELFQGQKFDVIILNSVVHCFPGHNYLRQVIHSCENLLQENGIIFVGDIMDLERKDKLIWKLKSFKVTHPWHRTKTEWHSELFLPRKYLQYLCDTSPTLKSVSFSKKIHTIQNELTEFRYDAIFFKSSHPDISLKRSKMSDIKTCASDDISIAFSGIRDSHTMTTLTEWSRSIDFADEAYVLYTSGTTGTPKGVIIGHEALLNYVQWASTTYKLNKGSKLPLFSPLTFDFTVTSIFPPLLNGSTIYIFKDFHDSYQELSLCQYLTTVKYSPLQLDTVLSATDSPLSASIFIIGGEELTSELLLKLKRNKGEEKFEVWNEYGPTEATVGCVVKCFSSDDLPLKKSELVTIGKPIDNVTIAVMRNRLNHVPVGGKGTLCIGGKCLCLDFAGVGPSKEAKRSKSFEVACWGNPGEHMLVTDDIAGVMPDSKEIAYYGRKESNTVKVNGIRVDLMEIQHAIEGHHLVHSAWVNSFTYANHKYLGAAIKLKSTTSSPATPSKTTWKEVLISSLKESLPSRCIPKVLLAISDPPTNSNGKKDAKLLQDLFQAELNSELEKYEGNSSNVSGVSSADVNKLQVIWKSILPIERLPQMDDDFFFDLSGDSLQAIHLVRRMRNEGFEVSVGDIFQNPTISKLLQALMNNSGKQIRYQSSATSKEIQKFKPTPIIEEFLKRDHKNADHFALPSLLCFDKRLKTSVLKRALRSIMRKHSSLRSRFEIVDGVVLQEVLELQPNEPTVKEIKISCNDEHLTNEPAFFDLCQNLEQSHSLSGGVLMNAAIIDVRKKDAESSEKECSYVLLVVHHIAIDIVSWQQVLEDLGSALRMLSDNEEQEPELQKCSLPFESFCNALHEQVSGIFAEDIGYWKDIKAQCAESGLLVKENHQSTFKSAKWLSHSFDAVTLRMMSTRLKCSDEHILLTILAKALSSIHGKDKTAIVLESHGRQLRNVDSTSTVGWCTSMFPFVLETSQTDDIMKQVKQIEEKVKQVPHRGLGFGLLKADEMLTIPLPDIMFVFQGSLDASTKQVFDGGEYMFEHIPWIEIMLNELEQRRFHRHPEEILGFDLEIITWIHGGQLKIGCLFDTNTICESLVQTLVERMEGDLKILAKKLKCYTKVISAEIIPFFNINPDCVQTIKDSLMQHDIFAEEITVCPHDEALQSMIEAQDRPDMTIVVSRHTTETLAVEFEKVYKEFVKVRSAEKVITINADVLPNSVKLPAQIVQMDNNIVQLPPTLGQEFYNRRTDVKYCMPLTLEGYSQIGLVIARSIRARVAGSKYKVIAVDADYTLWDGECANGFVNFNKGNICLQKFLFKKKSEGFLLVILSKNSSQDVVNVFKTQEDQMILHQEDVLEIIANWNSKADNIRIVSNQLNLDLKSFVFIDDNPLECEEMVTSCPEVLTLQLPSKFEHVGTFLDNLWILDNMDVTRESSQRTEMYRNETTRQKDIEKVNDVDVAKRQTKLTELLVAWKMKMTMFKTNVSSLKRNAILSKRTAELLHRTNQFKLNDVYTKFSDFQEEDTCLLISLDDRHGSYGVVSVCVIEESFSTVKQWVISCRALGRMVERRILFEILKDAGKKCLQLSVRQTERNAPIIKFLETLGCSINQTSLTCVSLRDIYLSQSAETLHTIEINADETSFIKKIYSNESAQGIDKHPRSENLSFSPALKDVIAELELEWPSSVKEQSKRHHLFPVTPIRQDSKHTIENATLDHQPFSTGRAHVLKSVWMEVLKSEHNPQSRHNFLELGGNSFSAVFLISKLQRVLNIEISITDVLQNPTYGDLRNLVLQAPTIDETGECSESINTQFIPLSAAQQRMLIMQESAPSSTAYVETIALHTRKILNSSEIFGALVNQHPILKTKVIFFDESQCYAMTTHKKLDTDTEVESLGNLAAASEHLTQSTPCIKVLSNPLVKFRHLEAEEITILALHVHHIIVDEITLNNIAKDLQELMEDSARIGIEISHPFTNMKTTFRSNQQKSDAQYWTENFKTLPPEVKLAILPQTEAMWKDTAVYKAKHSESQIAVEVMEDIAMYCQERGMTPFQYFLACTLIVLQRYLGVDEVVLAVPVTTRTDLHQDTDGLFVNTVLFRYVVDCTKTFEEHMAMVAGRWLEALQHAQFQFDEVVKILMKDHKKSPSYFCCTMFNFASKVWAANVLEVRSKHAKMPLTLDIFYNERERTGELVVEWASGLVDDGVAKRLADGVVNMFCNAVKTSDIELDKITVLSPLEREFLQSFSQCHEEISAIDSQPIQVLFEQHAEVNPNATAISCNGSSVSYKDVNKIASSIAGALFRKFSQASLKSKPVVIVMDKDENAIASILGIWKAGGHFLPVAPNMQSSLKDILKRCKPVAIIFNVHLEIAEADQTCAVINIKDLVTYPPEEFLRTQKVINDHDLAYIIRTSGSTGEPKQCKVSHKSLKTVAQAWTIKYQMEDFGVRVLQWAPISFDVFIGDVVRGLICSSGQLVICPERFRLDVFHILKLLKTHGITMAEVTPQFGLQLVENSEKDDLASLKLLILGSDVLQNHVFQKIKSIMKEGQRVINSYGMTEATIDSLFYEGPVLSETRSGTVPIGKPLPGVRLHILDTKTNLPCPVGTIGELYISGNVLASGDVEVTHLNHASCLALKTGDSACWLPTGDVDLIGRLDSVVKLRGFRISTREIENKIATHVKGIKESCVVPMLNVADRDGSEFLCAFLVLENDAGTMDVNGLRHQLRGYLPYYMLPDIVHIIDNIPLTAHGKINLKALPNLSQLLELNSGKLTTQSSSSFSPTAILLKELLSEALGIPDSNVINPGLTFMELGAHSLVLVRLSSLIKQKSSFNVEIADLFSYPTISALAEYIDHAKEVKHQVTYDKQLGGKEKEIEMEREGIAITGIGMRLPPNITSLAQFWKILDKGEDLIREFPKERLKDVTDGLDVSRTREIRNKSAFQGAFLEQIDTFDSHFFKIAPGEAKFMSPEQRLFLQVATEALAEAKGLSKVKGTKIGVFVGSSEVGYTQLNHPDEAVCISGLLPGMIATRVAYQWDLKGPTMLIDTACSSSLVALKIACESIKNSECEGALVGGVSLILHPARCGVFGQTSILSEDFHCRAFDRDASGTAVGEGVMCLYVEPISKALKEGKSIYGVITGAASNSVGRGNGITAPTAVSQQMVIQDALRAAKVGPSDISFIEAHGTGTKLGDKIELSGLSAIFDGQNTVAKLPIGSIKTIFGHLDSAAGMLGVFKILASFVWKKICPNANFKMPNVQLENSSLYVPSKSIPWETKGSAERMAGVSSFGLTGTNCHVIVRECTTKPGHRDVVSETSVPLLFSGRSIEHIIKQISEYKTYIEESTTKKDALLPLCVTVARRLKDISDAAVGHALYRMAIIGTEPERLLNITEIAYSFKDPTNMVMLANLRDDVHLYSPENTQIQCKNSFLRDFLMNGTIDLDGLFACDTSKIKSAKGVSIAMYDETRHWLDPCTKNTTLLTSTMNLNDILQKRLEDTREMVRSLPLSPTEELSRMQGKFCAAIIVNFFKVTNIAEFVRNGKEISIKDAFLITGMHKKYEKFFFVMIRELYRNQLVRATGCDKSICYLDSFKFECANFFEANPEVIANTAIEKYPSWADCFRFPLYCSQYFEKVLLGKMSPLSVIYPQGNLNFMYQFDKLGDLLGDVYYNMYMQIIAEYAKQLSNQGKSVRVLEVGAGVGHVTRQLLPKMKDIPNIEYWFTDLGKAFVEHAKTLFPEYLHMMKLSTFDITKNAPKQGILGSFDIVISYNVIHTTESIMTSVVNLKSCLSEEGTLFIVESARNDTWATLAWGLLDGWWYFKDYELRPSEPMLEPDKWESVLKDIGFGSIHACPVNKDERKHVEKCLFVCSNKQLEPAEALHPAWWETDAHKFDPYKEYSEDAEDVKCTDSEVNVQDNEKAVYQELKIIWLQLLGIDNINSDDDFNSLGGESLLAIQMIRLVRQRIGFQLEIADTFGYPTLGSLAIFIAHNLADKPVTESKESHEQSGAVSTEASKPNNGVDTKFSQEDHATEVFGVRPDERLCHFRELKERKTMIMFPGQGAQKRDMCMSMKNSSEACAVFSRAEQILGYNVLELFLSDNTLEIKEKLNSTEFVQVSLFLSCIAKIEQLKVERPGLMNEIICIAGLSVGEFAALVYAGVISFEDALKLVQERGKAMDKEIKLTATGMISVLGPVCSELELYLKDYFPNMTISTYLADNQHTVAGTEEDCLSLVEALSLEEKKLSVIDARKLRVAGGFHSAFMKNVEKTITPLIQKVKFSKPAIPVIMNVNAEVVEDPQEIQTLVCQQLVSPVQWRKTILKAYELGVRNFVEVAPARVLSSIVQNRIEECRNCTTEMIKV